MFHRALTTSLSSGAMMRSMSKLKSILNLNMFSSGSEVPGEMINFFKDGTFNEEILPDLTILSDRSTLQRNFSSSSKGWLVPVHWAECTRGHGLSVFASEDIEEGTVMRRGVLGVNVITFAGKEDIARLENNPHVAAYAADYVGGYQLEDGTVRCYFLVPGCAINHCAVEDNILAYWPDDDTFHCVAKRNIAAGDQIFLDYNSFGLAPEWLVEWRDKTRKELALTFKGQNDYV